MFCKKRRKKWWSTGWSSNIVCYVSFNLCEPDCIQLQSSNILCIVFLCLFQCTLTTVLLLGIQSVDGMHRRDVTPKLPQDCRLLSAVSTPGISMHLNRHGVSNERLLIQRFSSPMLAQLKQGASPLDAIHVLHLNLDAVNILHLRSIPWHRVFENYQLVHYLPLELRRWLTTRFQ